LLKWGLFYDGTRATVPTLAICDKTRKIAAFGGFWYSYFCPSVLWGDLLGGFCVARLIAELTLERGLVGAVMRYAIVIVSALGLARWFFWLVGQHCKNPSDFACQETPKRGTLCNTNVNDYPRTGTETPEVSREMEMMQNQEGILASEAHQAQQRIYEIVAKAKEAQHQAVHRPPVGRESAAEGLSCLAVVLEADPTLRMLIETHAIPDDSSTINTVWHCSFCSEGRTHCVGRLRSSTGRAVQGGMFVCDRCGRFERRP
jgi:hypothetical protein